MKYLVVSNCRLKMSMFVLTHAPLSEEELPKNKNLTAEN